MLPTSERSLPLQQTLKHLSRLSNTVLSEDMCACLATGELPPGMVRPPSPEQKQLTEEEHAELAAQSQQLAARLPKLNLGTLKKRTGTSSMIILDCDISSLQHQSMIVSCCLLCVSQLLHPSALSSPFVFTLVLRSMSRTKIVGQSCSSHVQSDPTRREAPQLQSRRSHPQLQGRVLGSWPREGCPSLGIPGRQWPCSRLPQSPLALLKQALSSMMTTALSTTPPKASQVHHCLHLMWS